MISTICRWLQQPKAVFFVVRYWSKYSHKRTVLDKWTFPTRSLLYDDGNKLKFRVRSFRITVVSSASHTYSVAVVTPPPQGSFATKLRSFCRMRRSTTSSSVRRVASINYFSTSLSPLNDLQFLYRANLTEWQRNWCNDKPTSRLAAVCLLKIIPAEITDPIARGKCHRRQRETQ